MEDETYEVEHKYYSATFAAAARGVSAHLWREQKLNSLEEK